MCFDLLTDIILLVHIIVAMFCEYLIEDLIGRGYLFLAGVAVIPRIVHN